MDWTATYDDIARYIVLMQARDGAPTADRKFRMRGGWLVTSQHRPAEYCFFIEPYDVRAIPVIAELFPSVVFDSRASDTFLYLGEADFMMIKLAAKWTG